MADEEPHAYLIEYTRIGAQVRVMACDSQTGIEAVVIAPANLPQKEMNNLAVRKLKYLLEKHARGEG